MRRSPSEPHELPLEVPPLRVAGAHAGSGARERRLGRALALLGAAVVGFLAWRGGAYYLLSPAQRVASPMHARFGPAGDWGWAVGFVSSVFMLANLVYALRRRVIWLAGAGDLRSWRVLHAFAGVMSALLVAFHAACPARDPLATAVALALGLVTLTGAVGRGLLGLAPAAGHGRELEDLQRRFVRVRGRLERVLAGLLDPGPVERLVEAAVAPLAAPSLPHALARFPLRWLRRRLALRRIASLLPEEASWRALRDDLRRCETLRLQIGCYGALERAARRWRVLHASLAALLVLATAAHVVVQVRWPR